jgi:hypothetical protein
MGCVMARAAALVPALLTLAVSVCVAPAAAGTFEFHATADTYVDSASPRKEFGTAKRVWTNGDVPLNQTFVRFKVAGLTGTVTDAVLRLYVTDGTSNGPAVLEVTDAWSERTTNWNNRPSRTSTPRDDKDALSAGRWVKWDVTPWVTDDGTVSFTLRGGAGNKVGLSSREATRDPQLVITTTSDPPPPPPPAAQCADGVDNDSDGVVDFSADPGCSDATDDDETDAPLPPPPPFGEPVAIAGQGYRQVFRDDFDGTSLGSAWTPKQFWEDDPRPGAVAVSDGTVKIRNAWPYYDDQSITTGPYSFGDPVEKAWEFGYFEARMKFTDATGSWPAFWLISSAHATWTNWPTCPEPDLNFELDIMEYQGDEPTQFYGTEHRNTGDLCGTPDATRSVFTKPGKLAGTWHTFALKWTSTDLTWYVDGVQQGSPQPLFDSGDQLMYLALTMQACGWDSSNACDSSTPAVLETEVDYVDVWQK